MNTILLIRILTTATFFILVIFGPLAFMQMRNFIKHYIVAHAALEARVIHLESQVKQLAKDLSA